ncbi:uncharacterized protein LOC123866193 isoform X1 [Maniola jurtina]|uniref:uncharacterized protein LOC123866193 isoform X1 n=1 Tax=Maniola jurtina TaxID=191418 RepID=UPI001E68DE35|nr:uncharacterized protein LOC123866193 isoform X1 [Maniola jurtina]
MEVNITPVAPNRARKRIRDPAHWKRNIKKRERYMPKNLPNLSISCTHKSKLMNCSKLTSQDLRKFREAFYSKPEKNFQDNFILKYMKVKVPSRKKRGERKRERIKHEQDSTKKAHLIGELRLHKLKAKCFHRFLKEYDPSRLTISFDCQKNQVLPKVPDQSAYYSRQLYIYNFTIVKGNETQNISKENVYINCWTENTHRKSSNEIASALYFFLKNCNLEGKKVLRLMGDGCGSQNKNSTIIAMLSYWLVNEAHRNLKTIELIFPVPGHSFLPADRVFGLIEKEVKNMEQIIHPQSYIDIYEKYGQVTKLGMDCSVFNWKELGMNTLKRPGEYHFQFLPCKRFYLKRVKNNPQRCLLKGEVNYNTDLGAYKSVIKKNKSLYKASVPLVEAGKVKVSALKIGDVKNLLKSHFGENWETQYGDELNFYTNIITKNTDDTENANVLDGDTENENHDLCNYYPEEIGLSV